MLLCFLAAWPVSTVKAYRARTAKGTSLGFMLIVEAGYLCGLASKFISGNVNFVAAFYVINICVVGANVALYFRNRRIDSSSETRLDSTSKSVSGCAGPVLCDAPRFRTVFPDLVVT